MIEKIGKISYDKTVECEFKEIYKGTFANDIEVKVRVIDCEKVTDNEVDNFLKLNSHPNVQRLYGHEFKYSNHYFALRDFGMTLKDFIKLPKNKRIKISPVHLIKDITEGLKFLHDNKFIHGNISFSNVGIDKESKRAVLCNCGLNNLQEDIFVTPEELSCEDPSFKADIFNLGIIIFYILSNGKHPFGSFQNSNATIKNIKEMSTFKCNIKDLANIIPKTNNKFKKSTYRAECAISMLGKILQKNPSDRLKCNQILEEPFFLSNYKIYEFFKRINISWTESSDEDGKLIDEKGLKQLKMISYQFANVFKELELNENDRKSLVKIVNAIASKIKHYEDEINIKSLMDQHILYYLHEFPFLLSLVYDVDKEIFSNKTNSALNGIRTNALQLENIVQVPTTSSYITTDASYQSESSIGFQEARDLLEIFKHANLPSSLIIKPENIEILGPIKLSKDNYANADVYYGEFKGIDVAIKKISKNKFKINEVAAHFELSQRKSSNPKIKRGTKNLNCQKCKKEECENVIKFYGCFEEQEFYCLVLEKAEMDLKDFIEQCKEDIHSNEQIKRILFDAANGLECLHANHISHLDIKPQNILVVKRNGKLIGCLADFGESVEAIKKTYTKTKLRITDGYVAPELLQMARHKYRTVNCDNTRKQSSASINYSKCDIYSLGMVIMRDYVRMEINDKTSTSRSLSNFRRKGKINFLCEELANFMTETIPINRPDAEGVRKNPFFWTSSEQLEFLKDIDRFGRRHPFDQNKKKEILTEGKKKLFVIEGYDNKNLIDFFNNEPEIQMEIKNYLEPRKKDLTSVFVLVELIIFILTPESFTHFPQTKKNLHILNSDTDQPNLDDYLKFWFDKFELIAFLYYKMQEDLKFFHHKYYSKGNITRR